MTRICPQCGNSNDDAVKYCTACGMPLVLQAGQPVTATTPPPAQVSPAAPPVPKSAFMSIAFAVVAVIIIVAALYVLQISGIIRVFPFSGPAVTPRVTPTVTSYVMTETPLPETTTPDTVITTAITNVTESPVTSPSIQKPPICPSDRFACSGECRDLMTDTNNCGGCNVTCGVTEICQMGDCMAKCADTQTSCPDGCHDLRYDALNCGTCGNACPTGLVCNRSLCSLPLATTIPTYAG